MWRSDGTPCYGPEERWPESEAEHQAFADPDLLGYRFIRRLVSRRSTAEEDFSEPLEE